MFYISLLELCLHLYYYIYQKYACFIKRKLKVTLNFVRNSSSILFSGNFCKQMFCCFYLNFTEVAKKKICKPNLNKIITL